MGHHSSGDENTMSAPSIQLCSTNSQQRHRHPPAARQLLNNNMTKHFQPCQSEYMPNKLLCTVVLHSRSLSGQLFPCWVCHVSEAKSSHTKLMSAPCKSFLFPVVALICHPRSFMARCLDRVLGLFFSMSSEWSGDLSSVSLIIKLLWKRASAWFLTCNAKCRPGYLASCLPRCFSLEPYWLLPD